LLLLTIVFSNNLCAQNASGHSLFVCQDNTIRSFGRNVLCQLGIGYSNPDKYKPEVVVGIDNAVSVAVGNTHSLALLSDGTVMAWGNNNLGATGQPHPSVGYQCTPIEVSLPGCAVAVSAGTRFSMALLADGTVWCWGADNYGQLGNGTGGAGYSSTAVQAGSFTNAVAISAGGTHALALLADSTVVAWGRGLNGQVGNGASTTQHSPQTVVTSNGTLADIIAIDAGDVHNIAMQDDGDIYTWGNNLQGALGIGSITPYFSNVAMNSTYFSAGTAIDIAAGSGFTMVLRDDGSTLATGINGNWQFGITSPTSYQYTPIPGAIISNAIDIVVPSTASHGWAIKANGELWAWGNNLYGTVGIGSTANKIAPPKQVNYSGSLNQCNAIPTEANHPQPCCVAIQEDDRTPIGNGTTINSGTVTYTGNFALQGTLTLNGGTLNINAADVICEPGSKIVNNGGWLFINNGSHLYACSDMWEGIEVYNGAMVIINGNALIEDAKIALDMDYGAAYVIEEAIFNKNRTHINLHMPSSGTPSWTGDYRIKRSRFLCQTTASIPLIGSPVYTNLLAPYATERTNTAIAAVGIPKILLGSSSAADANTVENCGWGMLNWTVGRIEALNDTFREIENTGVYCGFGPGNGVETIDVSYNTIEKTRYGIFCYDNSPTVRTHITYNTIDFAGMVSPPQVMTGITYQEITAASGYDPITPANSEYNYVDISDNEILNAPCGIQLINLTGDQTAPDAKLYVGENNITHTKIPNDGQAGIKTSNVVKGVFKANTITHPSGNVNWWETGMRLSGGYGNALVCNNTHHVGRGIFFDGWQTPDTRLIQNTMEANQTGLFLNWSVIGPQGSSGSPRDNKWPGTSWNSSNPNTHVEGTSGLLSPFYVRSFAPYNPQYNNFNPVAPLTIITTSGSWGGGCIYTSGASFKTDGAANEGTETLLVLMHQEEPETEREQSLQYMGHYNLYEKLRADAELTASDSELEAYVAERNADNMGKLHRVVSNFRSARAESEDLATGADLMNGVQPENLVEQTLKDVFGILYANATDLEQIDEDNELRLREIAQLCPLDYGFGVYTARAALIKLDTLPKNYVSECERVPSPEQMSEKRALEDEGSFDFSAYPNPANAAVTVNYKMEDGQRGRLQIVDVSGRAVRMMELKSEESILELQITDVTEGLYILSIEVDGQTKLSERIAVIRP